ncbi:hypothetical protein MVEN_00057600 [Mycena venus]|uniref:DUF6534 domain-containing protein n=1 Tax=Mycena venus TaxID=2733690 RepID=A0A8H7DF21_9AGAR|nr:hypothetical protein MVEN_00057600 [Mycena venus]
MLLTAAGIAQTVVSYHLGSYTRLSETTPITTVQSAASLACDLLVMVCLCISLRRRKGGIEKTRLMLDRLISDAINRGTLTSLSSGMNMVLFLTFPNTFWFFLGLTPSSELYMITFLTSYVLEFTLLVDASPFAQAQLTPAYPGPPIALHASGYVHPSTPYLPTLAVSLIVLALPLAAGVTYGRPPMLDFAAYVGSSVTPKSTFESVACPLDAALDGRQRDLPLARSSAVCLPPMHTRRSRPKTNAHTPIEAEDQCTHADRGAQFWRYPPVLELEIVGPQRRTQDVVLWGTDLHIALDQ